MKLRSFWLSKIEDCWAKRPIVWLSGVRRAGKTVLAQSLPGVEYFDCELSRTRFFFEDPEESIDFGQCDFGFRLLRGGLPPLFLSRHQPEIEFHEWMDSFWSRDIQELFRLERRQAFLKLVELLFVQSGSIFEAAARELK